jgi:hypothetical protein
MEEVRQRMENPHHYGGLGRYNDTRTVERPSEVFIYRVDKVLRRRSRVYREHAVKLMYSHCAKLI